MLPLNRIVRFVLISLLTFGCLSTSTLAQETKLPKPQPLDMKSWKSIPCVQGRLATKEDIANGTAAFVLDPSNKETIAKPINLSLPACAILTEDNKKIPVVIIQAEEIVSSIKVFGAVDVFSGLHILFSGKDDFEILEKPNDSFFK